MKIRNWKQALEKFLKPWKENKDVTGIIVCGSYITGNPTKNSDIDIHIVLKSGCKWRERGNKIVDEILMEYFANPPEQIEKYMQADYKKRRKIDAHMFATGRIELDKVGEVKRLKGLAKEYLNKKFEKMPDFKVELSKYHLFDMTDNLEEVYLRMNPDFNYVYFNFLNKLYDIYCEYLGYEAINENKVLRFLTDKNDKKKYLLKDFPDKVFLREFVRAIIEKKDKIKLKRFAKLVSHVQNKMGGFKIDGWKFRSPVEISKKPIKPYFISDLKRS